MPKTSRNILLLGFAIIVGLAAVYLLIGGSRPYTFQGSLIDPPVKAPAFELNNADGQSFQLQQLDGQVVIMFFGYTSCPDVCPVTLTEFLRIREELGKQAGQVSFVFVTVDPERDTPERMRKYLTNFDPEIIGLTGERGELESVWADYGVYQAKADDGNGGNYLVDHSSRTYIIDQDGNLRLTYPFGTENESIVADVRHLVSRQ